MRGPALLAAGNMASVLEHDGRARHVSLLDAQRLWNAEPSPIVLNAPLTARKLGIAPSVSAHQQRDILELFLFVHPTTSVAPTLQGISEALNISPGSPPDASLLVEITRKLVDRLHHQREASGWRETARLLLFMRDCHWAWRHDVQHLLQGVDASPTDRFDAVKIWRRLPKWEETAPHPPPGARIVKREDALQQLSIIVGEGAASRPSQRDFTSVACEAFKPIEAPGMPELVLAEAGTGTGKTAGYLAPATLWAEQNDDTVWISTYTRHLQKQIERELYTLYPDQSWRRKNVVVRKGRENYLCLLNLEDAVNVFAAHPAQASAGASGIVFAFISRWASLSQDGDLIGGDLPGWFFDLYDRPLVISLADRRGECIYSACPHYQTCFVEHSIRRADHARIVIANHALVMAQSAWALHDDPAVPDEDRTARRYVLDEGHHLPDAADSAFSVAMSGREAAELRRWLLGAEGGRSRARGLRRRLDDLIGDDSSSAYQVLAQIIAASQALPSPGWLERLSPDAGPWPDLPASGQLNFSENPFEAFLQTLLHQLDARTHDNRNRDQSECDLYPPDPSLAPRAASLTIALQQLKKPLEQLVAAFLSRLSDPEYLLETTQRIRLEAAVRALKRRAVYRLDAWIDMLAVFTPQYQSDGDDRFVDIIRRETLTARGLPGLRFDIGIHRHWRDPTIPFATVMQGTAHGVLVTSATLRDQPSVSDIANISDDHVAFSKGENGEDQEETSAIEASWRAAEYMIGAAHFLKPPMRASLMSPYDYKSQTRAFIVTDVSHKDISQLAAAFEALFLASGGGALGLFTAISRLRSTHKRLASRLESRNLPLYAQHVDPMDNATLVDIFRSEINSCLLGTDAMRDGIDIRGDALRLVVFEKTPWPRPDILHRERRRYAEQHGAPDYDDHLTRMRIRQGFGRLIRSETDKGVFVTLDRQFPSRLLNAFPEGVGVERLGLKDVVQKISEFLT